MRTNTAAPPRPVTRNSEGVPTLAGTPMQELQRTVLACMLWERGFYESGEDVVARIRRLVPLCPTFGVAALAVAARNEQHLRHVPLLLARELARHPQSRHVVGDLLSAIVQRPDELTEFLSLYWAEEKAADPRARKPLAKQVKKGLADAFARFNEYSLAKYNRDDAIKLKDVLFMVHAKPQDDAQAALWKRLIDGTIATPDTWEVALSAGADKKATFERLITDGKLGYMALLRNLRKMTEVGVPAGLISGALLAGAPTSKALPFRYIAAARACPSQEPALDKAMQIALAGVTDRLQGETVILVDTSPSMAWAMSAKSDLTRKDGALALAILLRGVCEAARVVAFSSTMAEVPPRQGMALGDAIARAVPSNGTTLGAACRWVAQRMPNATRLIVFTDEESQDPVPAPHCRGYMVNVSTTKNGVGYGDWVRVTGFSESVVQWIVAHERADAAVTP